ncbi:MAG: two-component system, chemotaxis family, sensor kinase Cph1, partial [Thermoleophilaceae bacterium]|nr:two-component system, chemotaxis family, sensor kinase Cph1 [Thermoleophilaceae bacterium]
MQSGSLPTVRRGDHACCIFASDDDQARLVGQFARDAFERGDRLFYLADRSDEDAVVALLDEAALDGRARLDMGALQILHSSEMGLESGFDPERQFAVWHALTHQARTDGYGGLAAATEMTWAQTWKLDPEVLLDYETTAGGAFASGELSALCQYDSRFFDHDVVHDARRAHAVAVAVDEDRSVVDWERLRLERE